MHLFGTIPVTQEPSAAERIRGVVTDLFAGSGRDGGYYFVRTWDRRTGQECVQLSIESDHSGSAERVGTVAAAHGFSASVEEIPLAETPSPLWNSGLGGPGFDAMSRRLCRDVAPALVRFATALQDAAGDQQESAFLALRLMVAHAAATLLESEQRSLPLDFGELLALRLLSYRSHYEGVYAKAKDPEAFEQRYAAFYAHWGERVRELVGSTRRSPVPDDPVLGQWVAAIRTSFPTVREGFATGTLVSEGHTDEDITSEVPVQLTRFHSLDSPALNRFLHQNADFLAYRLQTSLLYSCLHTLGFTLPQRYLFCYLLARANEDVAGQSTQELQQGLRALARRLVTQ